MFSKMKGAHFPLAMRKKIVRVKKYRKLEILLLIKYTSFLYCLPLLIDIKEIK